jgi:outer membrane protein assembly factor BamE
MPAYFIMQFIMKKTILLILVLAFGFGLTSCGWRPYKVPIQQGNVLDSATVNQIKTGMTRDQVRSLLGEPVLVNVFDPDTWSYVYTEQKKESTITRKYLILYFKFNNVVAIKSSNTSTK